MVRIRFSAIIAGALIFVLVGCLPRWTTGLKAPKVTKEELKSMLGNTDVVVIDVRLAEEWKKSQSKIIGAVREDPEKEIKTWVDKYPKEKTLVFYCE